MLEEHERLHLLLDNFEKTLKNNAFLAGKKLDVFKWNLEKHFFLEERAVFVAYSNKSENEKTEIDKLIKEHINILSLLSDLEKEFLLGRKPDFSELNEMMRLHSKFENELFYPKLEKELDDEQKESMILKSLKIIGG